MRVNKILFVGTGGGNDIFSTWLAGMALADLGWQWKEFAVAGVLSPFHDHSSKEHGCGISTTEPQDTRSMFDGTPIKFVDAAVAAMCADMGTQVYGLSLARGTVGLVEAFKCLAKEYDYIVLVDVGGDIFYRGAQDQHILSPMFDAMVLRAFIDSGVPGTLFEAGPGTDGEMEPDALQEALERCDARKYRLTASVIEEWQSLYRQWIEPVRPGRTVPMTLEAYESYRMFLKKEYRCRAHIGQYRAYTTFQQTISTLLCQNFYLVEPALWNPFAVACDDPMDWFYKTQVQQHRTSNEANLEYAHVWGELAQFVTPSPMFSADEQKDLIRRCLANLEQHQYDCAYMFPEDCVGLEQRFAVDKILSGLLCVRNKT
ncbi:MAG: DUF1152 domain-containing protein [Patescibacteria group bacterium]